ncbi:MAG: methyltransferase domain-containing protein [Solirubrobacterales bacterium]|nr:methyltransferase domain-containing protein [Solirubrobacterales bacterium]
MHERTVVSEFTRQAESFNRSSAATDADLLDVIVALAAAQPTERWLEAACGPGLIARRLAPTAGAVEGVDMTPAMIDVARREAAAARLRNVTFSVGDATALDCPDRRYDGAVARFALHHIPLPGRLARELARVVAPGGRIVLADHLADPLPAVAAWSQEIERLRDPSHWSCLSRARLRDLCAAAGLELEREDVMPLELDFDDWLRRGGGGDAVRALVEEALADPPGPPECFRVFEREGRRILRLQVWVARLSR